MTDPATVEQPHEIHPPVDHGMSIGKAAVITAVSIILVIGSTYVIDQALNPDPYMKRLNAASDWRVRTLPG